MEWKKFLGNWSLYALIAGAVSWLIAYAFTNWQLLKDLPTVTFAAVGTNEINVRNEIASGISPNFGNGVLDFFKGYIPVGWTGFFAVLITAFIVILAGALVHEWLKKWVHLKGSGNILVVFGYAGIIFVVLSMFLFNMPYSLAIWATIIYYAVLSGMMYLLSLTKVKQLEIPA